MPLEEEDVRSVEDFEDLECFEVEECFLGAKRSAGRGSIFLLESWGRAVVLLRSLVFSELPVREEEEDEDEEDESSASLLF